MTQGQNKTYKGGTASDYTNGSVAGRASRTANKGAGLAVGAPSKAVKERRVEVGGLLKTHVANMFALSFKLKTFHWNLEGARFYPLHTAFAEEADRLWSFTDEAAERIPVIGEFEPETLAEIVELSKLTGRAAPSDAEGMLEELITCYIMSIEDCVRAIDITDRERDKVTALILTEHLRDLERALWSLRSSRAFAGEPLSSKPPAERSGTDKMGH